MPEVVVVSPLSYKLSRPFNLAEASARIPDMVLDGALDAGVQKRGTALYRDCVPRRAS